MDENRRASEEVGDLTASNRPTWNEIMVALAKTGGIDDRALAELPYIAIWVARHHDKLRYDELSLCWYWRDVWKIKSIALHRRVKEKPQHENHAPGT